MTTTAISAPPTAEHARQGRPRWARPALYALLAATAVLYIWGLGASGWANAYYSAAAQAGSVSWKALFFGSFDAASAITVDKTPASLWIMGLSARLFGVSSWSILVPQALMGVGTVAVVHIQVRRVYGDAAGLVAGAALALTPVAALMFRFNNPDALLVLLLAAAAYATLRAVERGGTWWLVLAGSLVGFGFLAKMLQALLVLPALGITYLVAADARLPRRLWQLAAAFGAMVVSAGWWVAIVALVPASERPYVGGSQTNSVLELTLGYNGLARLTGEQAGSVGGGGPGGWGTTGWTRLFDAEIGGQIAWLMPAALLLLVAGLALRGRAPRADVRRAAFLLWGLWLVVTGLVFSHMQGIFHAYYTVALAPAVAALAGMGAVALWQRRSDRRCAGTLAVVVAVTAVWGFVLLGRSADFLPWLRYAALVAGLAAAIGIALVTRLPVRGGLVVAGAGLAAVLAGPAAYAVDTATTAHTGSIPSAGPSTGFGMGGPGGRGMPGGGPAGPGGRGGPAGPGGPAGRGGPDGAGAGGQGGPPAMGGDGNGGAPSTRGGSPGNAPGGAAGNAGQRQGSAGSQGQGQGRAGGDGAGRGMRGGPGGMGGGMGGLLNAGTPSSQLTLLLERDSDSYTWVAATVGANNAAGYQLATGEPVMALGGFNGTDPAPTLAQFKRYVAEKRIHYLIGGSMMGGSGGSQASQEIAQWVAANYTSTTVDGVTVCDLA